MLLYGWRAEKFWGYGEFSGEIHGGWKNPVDDVFPFGPGVLFSRKGRCADGGGVVSQKAEAHVDGLAEWSGKVVDDARFEDVQEILSSAQASAENNRLGVHQMYRRGYAFGEMVESSVP